MDYDLRTLYERHGHIVYRRARKILGHEDEAHEVVQEIFASLLEKPHQFSGRSSFVTWAYSATTHRCLNRLRNQQRRTQILEEEFVEVRTNTASPEVLARLRQALALLPAEIAQVLVHHHLDRMSKVEIAEMTGTSRKQVARALSRWTEQLRQQEAQP